MPQKRPNLAALAEVAGSTRTPVPDMEPARPGGDRPDVEIQADRRPPTRANQRPVTGYYPEEVRVQLKTLAAEQRRTMESMIGEALNDLFAKYGKPEIVTLPPRS